MTNALESRAPAADSGEPMLAKGSFAGRAGPSRGSRVADPLDWIESCRFWEGRHGL